MVEVICHCQNVSSISTCSHQKFQQWREKVFQGAANLGIDLSQGARLRGDFEKAGFVNIQVTDVELPIGGWHVEDKILKSAGEFGQRNLAEGLHGLSLAFLKKGLGMEMEEIDKIVEECREELLDTEVQHSFRL